MKLAVASVGAVRNLADHVEQVGTEPAWPPAKLSGIPKHPGRRPACTANVGTFEEVELRGSQIELLAGLGRFG